MMSKLLLIAVLSATSAYAQQNPEMALTLIELLASKHLSCRFGVEPMLDAADSSESADAEPTDFPLEITQISVREGLAQIGDTAIDGDVRLIPTNRGLHIYEFNKAGDLSIATVMAKADETGRYPAVLSRHLSVDGDPMPTQFTGYCRSMSE
jgi:hypothetical protein